LHVEFKQLVRKRFHHRTMARLPLRKKTQTMPCGAYEAG
jgi:hypothetical protein